MCYVESYKDVAMRQHPPGCPDPTSFSQRELPSPLSPGVRLLRESWPEYSKSTTVQSSLSGVPPQKLATAEKMSSMVELLAATVSRRESPKKSPHAFSAS